MGDRGCQQFQNAVSEYLVRHKSILDVMSRLQDSTAHVNRAIVKSVTACGCLKIDAGKQTIPDDASLVDIIDYIQTHVSGALCSNCLENVENELGNTLFYLAGICNLLGLQMDNIICKENNRLETLGFYNLT
ncbi:MAG: DUF1573 domain-containing protein [Actinomycetota bacterium]|nr:DUF1573 domain-containing protein [Actinomycetota bacterium]MDP2211293.1 hypothetical protein [Candidatus Aquicultor sp.]